MYHVNGDELFGVLQTINPDEVVLKNKRKTLSKLAKMGGIAAVLPSSWVKPVIGSVILPAHAQTSSAEISVRRSIPFVFGTVFRFSFDERAGSVFRISTTPEASESDLSIEVKVSGVKEADGDARIASNFNSGTIFTRFWSQEELALVSGPGRSNTVTLTYHDFFSSTDKRYGVEVYLSYREFERRIISRVRVFPK